MAEDFMDLLGADILALRPPLPTEFASHAIGDQEFQLPEKQALILSTERPEHPKSFSQLDVQRLTANKIRMNFMSMLQKNDGNIQTWIEQVAATSPKVALELLIEIAQFITPKLKATKIVLDDETRRNDANAMRDASIDQLQEMLRGANE